MRICGALLELLPENRQTWRSVWNVIFAKRDRLAAVCLHAVMMWSLKTSLSLRRHCKRQCILLTCLLYGAESLLEKPTGFQVVKNFSTFCGTRRFITAFTSDRHLSLSWASSIQSIPPLPNSWRSILILSSHLRLGLSSGLFPSYFPTGTLYMLLKYVLHAPPISFLSILSPEHYWASSRDHSAPYYAASSTPLLPRPSYTNDNVNPS